MGGAKGFGLCTEFQDLVGAAEGQRQPLEAEEGLDAGGCELASAQKRRQGIAGGVNEAIGEPKPVIEEALPGGRRSSERWRRGRCDRSIGGR